VGIGLVRFLDDLDATHNATPEKAPGPRDGSRHKCMRLAGRGLLPCRPERSTEQPRSRSIASFTGRRLECNAQQVSWLSRPRPTTPSSAQPANRVPSVPPGYWSILGDAERAASDTVLALFQPAASDCPRGTKKCYITAVFG